MQVEVHHVHTEIAGANLANQGVHVGAIHIKQPALGMHDVGNLVDLLFEDSQRIRIRQHQRGNIFVALCRQCSNIHHALCIGCHFLYGITNHRSRCRVSTVGRVRNENFLAWIAVGLLKRANHQQAGKLAMRPGRRLQRDRIHAGDFKQTLA